MTNSKYCGFCEILYLPSEMINKRICPVCDETLIDHESNEYKEISVKYYKRNYK